MCSCHGSTGRCCRREPVRERSDNGERFRAGLGEIMAGKDQIKLVRGKGLLNAMVIEPRDGVEAWDLCMRMAEHGLLAKPTHGDIIRFAPPPVIDAPQIDAALEIIDKSCQELLV